MILRINMTELTTAYEDLPKEWQLIGGRGLIAKIMNKEVSPAADPLSSDNKLIITIGPLAGTLAPQLGRISVGAKVLLPWVSRNQMLVVQRRRS